MMKQFLAFCFCGIMAAQAQQYYPKGQFPAGKIYDQASVQSLVGQQVPPNSYLSGRFLFLETKGSLYVFSTYSGGLTDMDAISFGHTFVIVAFHGNVPPKLKQGSVLVATADDPLTIKAVQLSAVNNKYTLIAADSWSTP